MIIMLIYKIMSSEKEEAIGYVQVYIEWHNIKPDSIDEKISKIA